MAKKCDHNCFSCMFDDCIASLNDKPTLTELADSLQRDVDYTNYGRVIHGKTKESIVRMRTRRR